MYINDFIFYCANFIHLALRVELLPVGPLKIKDCISIDDLFISSFIPYLNKSTITYLLESIRKTFPNFYFPFFSYYSFF